MPAGRPPKYNSVEEIEEKINQYFKSCEGTVLRDEEGNIIYDKYNRPIIINQKPLTITGLALGLGFNSRQSLLNYQDKKEFMDTIMRAKSMVEEYTESRLFDKEGSTGAKFSLVNNFKDWSNKEEREIKMDATITELPADERKKRIAELLAKQNGNT